MSEGPRRRLHFMTAVMIGLAFLIVVQLVNVQILRHKFYDGWAQWVRVREIQLAEPPRGVIRDRNGYLLAGNSVLYSIEVSPALVEDPERVSVELGALLHIPVSYVNKLLTSDKVWVQIAFPVSKDVGEQIKERGLFGISVRPVWQRKYPEGTLAAHLLGFRNAEGVGFYGVEGYYDKMLRPEMRSWEGSVDSFNQPVPWEALSVLLPRRGTDLALTIDRTLQALVEQELARSVEEYQAEGGTIVVMNPRNFEILAMASSPSYAPEKYFELTDQESPPLVDPAVSHQYEPGSVFKILTVAAALDAGSVSLDTHYHDQGWIEVGGQVIRNASGQEYGDQTVGDILIKSLNVGAAWLSTQIGPGVFYAYLEAFGIGSLTGVDLQGEASGQLWLPDDPQNYHDSNLGTNAFGQGVAVTPLQMISAVAAVANDGVMLTPHVIGRRTAPEGRVSVYNPTFESRVISREIARALAEVLVRVVDEGIPLAQVEGYRVAGKTGTAQIPIPGGYAREGTIATFIGFGPVPDPSLIVLVKLDRPQTSPWASQTAALTFQRLATRLFVVLGVPPEERTMAEAVG